MTLTVPPLPRGRDWSELLAVEGPWEVGFPPERGAPQQITLDRLAPLNQHPDDGVRHFSGIASYSTSFALPELPSAADTIWLDLGLVADIAEVYVNGEYAGTSWFAPDRVEIGHLLLAGSNQLEIRVANRWINRLIGDAQPGSDPVTWTAIPTYQADAPLRPSGLIGPVRLVVER